MILCKLSEILKRNGTKAIARLMIILLFLSISNISKAGWYFPFDGCDRWDMSVDNVVTSTYFQPQIEVSEDMCVGFVGYRDTKVLDLPFEAPDEECVTINPDNTYTYSNEGRCGVKNCETIISRFCARITGPEKYDNNYGCNTNDGICSGSSKCPECRCECTTRACAFDDPALPLDLNDDDPDKMEYHEMTNGEDLDFYMVSGFSYTDLYINQYVISNIGCVEIPLGPYPPPLCDPIQGMKPTTESADICEYSPKYEISNTSTTDDGHADNFKQKSLPGDTCELSTATGEPSDEMVYSTFEKPLVRLYFENLIELCKEDYVAPPEGTTKNDICLYLDTELTSEQIWKDKKNLLPVCSAGELSFLLVDMMDL